jgi:competence transcription factor ComK
MEIIETQFRAGNISYIEQKAEEVAVDNNQTMMTTMTGNERNKHKRKKSVLVTNFKKHVRHTSKNRV